MDDLAISARPPAADGKSERLHKLIARRLGVAIVSGQHPSGTVLEDEITASARMKVSRTAYREAIRILGAKGLVESRPKTGTLVSQRSQWRMLDPEVLAWMFESERPAPEFIRSLFELRMVVEPAAAGFAAERRETQDIARMREALQQMEKWTLAEEAGRLADRDFHDAILVATRNEPLMALSSSIGSAVRWTTKYKQRRRKLPRDPMAEHWTVFDAIAMGDADAARAAMAHLVSLALEDTRPEFEGQAR